MTPDLEDQIKNTKNKQKYFELFFPIFEVVKLEKPNKKVVKIFKIKITSPFHVHFSNMLFVGEFNKINNDPNINLIAILHKSEAGGTNKNDKLDQLQNELSNTFNKFASLMKKDSKSESSQSSNSRNLNGSSGPSQNGNSSFNILLLKVEKSLLGSSDTDNKFYKKLIEKRMCYLNFTDLTGEHDGVLQ